MSKTIEISDDLYERLSNYAIGFDQPQNVIERILNEYETLIKAPKKIEKGNPPESNKNLISADSKITLDPLNPDDLLHTKIIFGTVGREHFNNWNNLIYIVHKFALEYFGSKEKLIQISKSNITDELRDSKGFQSYPDLGISIQNENANKCWRNSLHLLKSMSGPGIEIKVKWRDKENASHPERTGILRWKPKNLKSETSNYKISSEDYPPYEALIGALLSYIYYNGGNNYAVKPIETYEPLGKLFNLPERLINAQRLDGRQGKEWQNRVQWTRQRLINSDLLDGSTYGLWQLTDTGIKEAEKIADKFETLKNY